MTELDDIPTFPETAREVLIRYGVHSAEVFYDVAIHNPEGWCRALNVTPAELQRLVGIAKGYLSPKFIEAAHKPTVKHPRGVIVDPKRPKVAEPPR
jgi:hypothetical protein